MASMNKTADVNKRRIRFLIIAFILIALEFIIGIFVHDKFIRPFVGDVIVVIILYAFARAVFPKIKLPVAAFVFVFAALYEFTQMLPLADVLGIQNRFVRVLMGTTFSVADIVCYLVGCGLCFGYDFVIMSACEERKNML